MDWLMRSCLTLGMLGLGLSTLFTEYPKAQAGQQNNGVSCSGSWACAGNSFNGCNFSAGRVPSCSGTGNLCQYNVPGYLCQGTNASGGICSQPYDGCQ